MRAHAVALLWAVALFGCSPSEQSQTKPVMEESAEKNAAAPASLPDISKMSDEELNKLPKEITNQLPFETVMRRFQQGATWWSALKFTMVDALSRLSYFEPATEEQLTRAIQKFQRDVGAQQTGKLTMGQYSLLNLRAALVAETPVYVSGGVWDKLSVFSIENEYVSTEGTWTIEGEKIANPINHSKITCRKSEKTCDIEQVDVEVMSADPNALSNDQHTVYTQNSESFEITSWSNAEVIAQENGECRSTIMTINIRDSEVFQITRNSGGNCGILPKLKSPRIARLIPTGKFSFDFWTERRRASLKYRNADVAKQMKQMAEAMKAEAEKKAGTSK